MAETKELTTDHEDAQHDPFDAYEPDDMTTIAPTPTTRHNPPRAKPEPVESPELFTVEQAANWLQMSQSSIRKYIRDGVLKAYKIAGRRLVLIPREELLNLLEPAWPELRESPA